MEPTAILKAIYDITVTIKTTVDQVKANKKQCLRLAERIEAMVTTLRRFSKADMKRQELAESLQNFRRSLDHCIKLVSKFSDEATWFNKIFKNQAYKEEFEQCNLRLSQCAIDLGLSINIERIFNHEEDVRDQETDLADIQAKLDDIARLMAKQQESQLKCYKYLEEHINQRFDSFRYHLMQYILKAKDLEAAKRIESEEHQFLHIPFYDLISEERLGHGGFADVYRGTWLSNDTIVAIKVIRIQYLNSSIKQDFLSEISTMQKVRFQNVLTVYGACMEPNYYAIVVEYMSLGSLFDVIHRKKIKFTWSIRWSFALQMTKGLNYLHMMSPAAILHRDVKSLNFLVGEVGNSDFIVKIGDFGLAEIRRETTRQTMHSPIQSVGTLHWKAPELLEMGRNTTRSDVYALGITFWELATGKLPYDGADESTIRQFVLAGKRLEIPPDVPKEYKSLIQTSWAPDPKQRPTCQALVQQIRSVITGRAEPLDPLSPK